MRTALSCSRWLWAILHIFWNCIIGLYSATDPFPSRVPSLHFLIISSVVFTHDVISVSFTQLLFHIWSEHILGMHIRAEFRRLQASARTTWLIRLGVCHLASLMHLLGTEQCPIWCKFQFPSGWQWWWTWLILVREIIIEVNNTKLRCNIQSREKVAVPFKRWYKSTRRGPLALVWI